MKNVVKTDENILQDNIFRIKVFLRENKCFFITIFTIFLKYLLFIKVTLYQENNIKVLFGSVKLLYIFIYLSCITLITEVYFLMKEKFKLSYLLIINIMISIVLLCDAIYYRSFGSFLSFYLIYQKSNLDGLGSSILALFRISDILFFLDIIFIYLLYKMQKSKVKMQKTSFLRFIISAIMPIGIMVFSCNIQEFKERYNSWNKDNTMLLLGPIGYHLKEGVDFIRNREYKLTDVDKKEINDWYSKKEEYIEDSSFSKFKGKNLIIMQVESLENFVVNQSISNQEITPNINKIIKNSIYFNNYRENTYQGNSSDADLMTNAGVYPIREGSAFFRVPNNQYKQSLPNLLKKLNYDTVAIKSDKGTYWNWKPALTSIGFDKCFDRNNLEPGEMIGFGLADHEYFERAFNKMQSLKEPFYSFLVTVSSHTPFKIPEKYKVLTLSEELSNSPLGDYFHSIHYTDLAIGKFFEKLESEGLLDNSVVVIYGDHTGPEKYFYDKIQELSNKQDWYLNNNKRIPLIIYEKDSEQEIRDINCSQIDLLPTLAYLMGVEYENYNMTMGKNMITSNRDYTILQDMTIIGGATEEQKNHLQKGILLNDKMVRGNYFTNTK